MPPVFGKILKNIEYLSKRTLSQVFSLSIEIFRMNHALLSDIVHNRLMSIIQNIQNTAEKVIIDLLNVNA